MNRNYIIGYVHWTWTITTVIIPFVLLVFLSTQIFLGLKKVKKNLNRHKRLQIKAEAKATTTSNGKSLKVNVNGENEVLSKFFLKIYHEKMFIDFTVDPEETPLQNGDSPEMMGNGTARTSIPSIIINPGEFVCLSDKY